jgi:hypothetical protein
MFVKFKNSPDTMGAARNRRAIEIPVLLPFVSPIKFA